MRPLPYSALKEIEHFVKNQTETFALSALREIEHVQVASFSSAN